MMYNLSEHFGEKFSIHKNEYYSFPTPERLAEETEANIKACKVGYRAKYIKQISDLINKENIDLEKLKK